MRRVFNDAERAWIKRRSKWPRRVIHAAFVAKFGRGDEVGVCQVKDLCKKQGWKASPHSLYGKGRTAWNKFKRRPPVERVDHQGYVVVRFWEGDRSRRVFKHRLLWETMHGPIPKGFVLRCRGDRGNPDPSNWDMIPAGVLTPLRNRGYTDAPAILKPAIMAVSKLEHLLRQKQRASGNDS